MNIAVSTLRGPEDPKATSPQQKQNTTRSAFILPNAKAEPQHLAPAPNLPGRFYTASSSHLCKLPRTEQARIFSVFSRIFFAGPHHLPCPKVKKPGRIWCHMISPFQIHFAFFGAGCRKIFPAFLKNKSCPAPADHRPHPANKMCFPPSLPCGGANDEMRTRAPAMPFWENSKRAQQCLFSWAKRLSVTYDLLS